MSNKHPKSEKLAIAVRGDNVDQAMRVLKKKLQREGVFREMKLRQHFEKPSEKKNREDSQTKKRWNKSRRKDIARTGESRKPQWN